MVGREFYCEGGEGKLKIDLQLQVSSDKKFKGKGDLQKLLVECERAY